MKALGAILVRDLMLAVRQGGTTLLVLVFYLLTVTLFPLGVGPEAALLSRIAGGVLWVAALLASLLALDRLFQADYEDGSLEMLRLSGQPMELIVVVKVIAHWLATGLPLALAAPALALTLHLQPQGYVALVLAMLIGTPVLSLMGAIGAALTVSMRRGGVLLSLLVLPLYVPVLVFGVGAVEAAILGVGDRLPMLILGALLLGALALAPWASAAALRLALE